MSHRVATTAPHPKHRNPVLRLLVIVLLMLAALGVSVPSASAAHLMTVRLTLTSNVPVATGQTIAYDLRIECSSTQQPCGNVTAKVDLAQLVKVNLVKLKTNLTELGFPNATVSQDPATGQLTIQLNAPLPAGRSFGLPIEVFTPNHTTPDGYNWIAKVQVTSDRLDVDPETAEAAVASVTASAALSVSKGVRGNKPVSLGTPTTYRITVCDNLDPNRFGQLDFETGTLVDHLPPGVTYNSSSPAGAYDAQANTVTWTLSALNFKDCSGPDIFEVTVTFPDDGTYLPNDAGSTATNRAVLDGVPYHSTTHLTADDEVTHSFVATPDASGEVQKRSATPPTVCCSPPRTYDGTWLTGPGFEATWLLDYSNDALPAALRITDNLPCTTASGFHPEHTSPVIGEATCQTPSFILEQLVINTAGPVGPQFQAAIDSGWVPLYRTTTDQIHAFVRVPGTSTFVMQPQDVQDGAVVATVYIHNVDITWPARAAGQVAQLSGHMVPDGQQPNDVFKEQDLGFVDGSNLPAATRVRNIVDYQVLNANDLTRVAFEERARADIYVLPTVRDAHLDKSMDGNDGTIHLHVTNLGSVPLEDVVVTDLLPPGVRWTTTWQASVLGSTDLAFTLETEDVVVNGVVRQLVRFTLKDGYAVPPGAIVGATIVFGATGVRDDLRGGNSLFNTAQVFLANDTLDQCDHDEVFVRTDDRYDLDGDGSTADRYCEGFAQLAGTSQTSVVKAQKLVKGDQDPDFLASPNVGTGTPGGISEFQLQVTNESLGALHDVVVYDIFPTGGDTGVRKINELRGSDFEPVLAGEVDVAAPSNAARIMYSTADLPCRGEVNEQPRAQFPLGCDDNWVDWAITPPADLAAVTGIRVDNLGVLPPSSTPNVTITVPMRVPADLDPGTYTAWNSFAIAGLKSDGQPFLPTEPEKVGLTAVVPEPKTDVELAKTVNGEPEVTVTPDATVHYKIYAYHGTDATATATGVVVEDAVPDGLEINLASVSTSCAEQGEKVPGLDLTIKEPGGSYDSNTNRWTVGDIAAGEAYMLCFDAKVTGIPGDQVTNIAQVVQNGVPDVDSEPDNDLPGEDDYADAIVRLTQPTDVELAKTVNGGSQATVTPGETVHYKIYAYHGPGVNGVGGGATARDVVVEDAVPTGLEIDVSTVSTSCATPGETVPDVGLPIRQPGGTYDPVSNRWTVGDIAEEEAYMLCFDAKVNAAPGATLTNKAEVIVQGPDGVADVDSTPGNGPGNGATPEDDYDEAVVNVTGPAAAPAISVQKTVKPADGSTVQPGQVVTYTVDVCNTGDAVGDVYFIDDANDVLDDASIESQPTSDNPDVTVTPIDLDTGRFVITGTLQPGKCAHITYAMQVRVDRTPGDESLENFVYSEDRPTTCPVNDNKCTVNPVGPATPVTPVTPVTPAPPQPPATPHVGVVKSVDPEDGSKVRAGDVLTYKLTFTNTGKAPGAVNYEDDLGDVLDDAKLVADPVSSAPTKLTASAVGKNDRFRVTGTLQPGDVVTVSYKVKVKPDGHRKNDDLVNFVFDTGQPTPDDCPQGVDTCTDNPVVDDSGESPHHGDNPGDGPNHGWLPNTGGPQLLLLLLGAALLLAGGGLLVSRAARR